MTQGIGYKDSDGTYGFRLTEDGKIILGNSSDDVIQVTGTLSILGQVSSSVEVSASAFYGDGSNLTGIVEDGLASNCVTEAKVATSVAGAGIIGGGGSALAVGAGTGVTVNSNDVAIGQAVGTGNTVEFSKATLNTSAIGSGEVMRIKGTGDNFNTFVVFGTDTTTEYVGLGVNSGVPTITGGYSGTTNASSLAFSTQAGGGTGEAEKVRITSDGKMGIGTTTPHANLSIEGDADGGVVSIRLGADDSSASNFSARLEMAEDTDANQVMTYGAFMDYDGDAGSPDYGMLHIGVRDNSTSDTNVVSISRKADANTFTLGDTSAQISVSGEVGLTSSGGSLNFDAPGNDINLNGTVNIRASNDLAVASTAQFSNTVTMTGDLNVDSNTLFVDASDNDIRIGTTTAVSTEKVLIRQTSTGVNTGIMLSKGSSTGDEYLSLDISGTDTAMITAGAYGTGDCALAFRTSNSSEAEVMRLSKEGRLGIGTTSPSYPLDVVGQINASTGIQSGGTLHCDGNLSVDGTNNSIAGKLNLACGGGSTTSPDYDDGLSLTTHNDVWYVYPKRISSSTTNVNLQFNADGTDYGYIDDGGSNDMMNFTGQHRCLPDSSTDFATLSGSVGKIVVSSGQYDNPNTTDIVTINESIPTIKLSNARNQKSAFGVISNSEDPNQQDRTYNFGAFGTNRQKKDSSDVRLHINSLGEGGIWISNINGNIENGDYITTCEIPGYGMKQDDDLLHNYTVAKITQDCLFDLNSTTYECEEIQHNGQTYRVAFVGCTYHCG